MKLEYLELENKRLKHQLEEQKQTSAMNKDLLNLLLTEQEEQKKKERAEQNKVIDKQLELLKANVEKQREFLGEGNRFDNAEISFMTN